MNKIITLMTDFGTKDGYAGSMKGVLKTFCPDAEIVDITHEIEPFNIRLGAYTIRNYYGEFPENTVHLAVVDPGVGGKRKAIVIKTGKYYFVGPDNGLFQYVLEKENASVYEILESEPGMSRISDTFHGRDIFAPAAAKLASGASVESFCRKLNEMKPIPVTGWNRIGNKILVEVLTIDHFGNIIFSITKNEFAGLSVIKKIHFKKFETDQIMKYYASSNTGTPLVLWNSTDFLEIAVNTGRAVEYFDVDPEKDKLELIIS